MIKGLVVILGKVPERISQYSTALQVSTPRFAFFSDITSFLRLRSSADPHLIIVDNVDGDLDSAEAVTLLRQEKAFDETVILVIVNDGEIDSGISALQAGGNDYLPVSRIDKELAIRAWMHWNIRVKAGKPSDRDGEFDNITPLEDRFIIQNAVQHIRAHVATISSVGDLALHVGRSERDINKAFTLHLKLTAFSYIRNYKICRAKKLLKCTRLPISQVALEVGYSNPNNFSTWFKSMVGINPSRYRAGA